MIVDLSEFTPETDVVVSRCPEGFRFEFQTEAGVKTATTSQDLLSGLESGLLAHISSIATAMTLKVKEKFETIAE